MAGHSKYWAGKPFGLPGRDLYITKSHDKPPAVRREAEELLGGNGYEDGKHY